MSAMSHNENSYYSAFNKTTKAFRCAAVEPPNAHIWLKLQMFVSFSILLPACPSQVRICKPNSAANVQDAVTKLHSYAAEVQIKAELEDRCGPTQEYWGLMQ